MVDNFGHWSIQSHTSPHQSTTYIQTLGLDHARSCVLRAWLIHVVTFCCDPNTEVGHRIEPNPYYIGALGET